MQMRLQMRREDAAATLLAATELHQSCNRAATELHQSCNRAHITWREQSRSPTASQLRAATEVQRNCTRAATELILLGENKAGRLLPLRQHVFHMRLHVASCCSSVAALCCSSLLQLCCSSVAALLQLCCRVCLTCVLSY
jgi:hypothetical protein